MDDKRRSDIAALDALIRKHARKIEPVIMGGMLGYGPFHYRYANGLEGDACKRSIASNASYISLYCFAADAKGDDAERHVDRLPKASIGKACVRFKKPRISTRRARGARQGDREDGPRRLSPRDVGAAVVRGLVVGVAATRVRVRIGGRCSRVAPP